MASTLFVLFGQVGRVRRKSCSKTYLTGTFGLPHQLNAHAEFDGSDTIQLGRTWRTHPGLTGEEENKVLRIRNSDTPGFNWDYARPTRRMGGLDAQGEHTKYSSTQARRREYANWSWLRGPSVTQDTDNSKYEAYCSKEYTKRVGPTQEFMVSNLFNMRIGRKNGWFHWIRAIPLVSLRYRRCCAEIHRLEYR